MAVGTKTRHGIKRVPQWSLKKNQNAPRPSEHPPVRGEKMSKRLGGIKGSKYSTKVASHIQRIGCQPEYAGT